MSGSFSGCHRSHAKTDENPWGQLLADNSVTADKTPATSGDLPHPHKLNRKALAKAVPSIALCLNFASQVGQDLLSTAIVFCLNGASEYRTCPDGQSYSFYLRIHNGSLMYFILCHLIHYLRKKNSEACKLNLTTFNFLVFSHSFLFLPLPSSVETTVFLHHFCQNLAGRYLATVTAALPAKIHISFSSTKLLLLVKDFVPGEGLSLP